jgi:D-alanyl-D-alanine dipeptidase
MKADFAFVDDLVRGVRWDAKYATADNFTGKPVDGYLTNRIVGTRALCAALEDAQGKAESRGFGLFLWDGYRPQRAGFQRYDCEWWHYTSADEPYPDTYFDFPIA